jgi:hypothetical protein
MKIQQLKPPPEGCTKKMFVYVSTDCSSTTFFDFHFLPGKEDYSAWKVLFVDYPALENPTKPERHKEECQLLKELLEMVSLKMPGISLDEWHRNGMVLMMSANYYNAKFAYTIVDVVDQ